MTNYRSLLLNDRESQKESLSCSLLLKQFTRFPYRLAMTADLVGLFERSVLSLGITGIFGGINGSKH